MEIATKGVAFKGKMNDLLHICFLDLCTLI